MDSSFEEDDTEQIEQRILENGKGQGNKNQNNHKLGNKGKFKRKINKN
jgi:hypothetical protein